MMKKIIKKLKSKSGETLVEILVAIIIIALSAGLFATMYTASMNINLSAQQQDKAFYDAVGKLEEMEKSENSSKGQVKYRPEDGTEQDINVDIVTEDGLYVYLEGDK